MIYQVVFAVFTVVCIVICVWALIAIWRSQELRWKPAWALGSLFGFFGLGIDWTAADDLLLQIGLQIPVFHLAIFSDGSTAAKSLFPVVGLVAIDRIQRLKEKNLAQVFDEGSNARDG